MLVCLECNQNINQNVYQYSLNNYGVPLCVNHQRWIDEMSYHSTQETIGLYLELKKYGVPAEIEKFDGHKHIDIAIPEAKINIEVDGGHHNYDFYQAMSDLKRTYYSFRKGYYTIRIPNVLIYNKIEETAHYIVEILNESLKKNYQR